MMTNYSLVKLASEIEFDIEDYIPLLKLFVDTTDLNLAEIRSAAAEEDRDLISSNVHNIKGASLSLGLDRVLSIMEQISKLNRAGPFTDIECRVKECEFELNELRKLLE